MKKGILFLFLLCFILPASGASVDFLIREAVNRLAKVFLESDVKIYSRANVTVGTIENVSLLARQHYIGEALKVRIKEAIQDSLVFRYVDREHLEDALQELKLALSDITENNDEIRIGNIATAAFILNGQIIDEGNNFLLVLELLEVATTQVWGTVKVAISRSSLVEEADKYAFEYIMANGLGFTLQFTPHYSLAFPAEPFVSVGDDLIHAATAGGKITYRISRFLKFGLEFNLLMGDFLFDNRAFKDALNIPSVNKTEAYGLQIWQKDGTLGSAFAAQVADSPLFYTLSNFIVTFALPVSFVYPVNRSLNLSLGAGPAFNVIVYSQIYDSIPTRVEGGLAFKRYTVDMSFMGAGIFSNLDFEYFILPRFAVNGGISWLVNWMFPADDADLSAYSSTNGEAYYSVGDTSITVFGLNPYYRPDGKFIPDNFLSADYFKLYFGVSLYF